MANSNISKKFATYLNYEKGLSKATISAYLSDLEDFFYFCSKSKIVYLKVDRQDILNYLETIQDAKYTSSTICRRLVTLKTFYRFLYREHLIPDEVTDVIQSPKLWHKLPEFLSISQVDKLLNFFDHEDPLSIRNRAMIELIYSCGLRVSEVINLKLADLNNEDNLIFIRQSKRDKDRFVPFGKEAKERLNFYFENARLALVKSEEVAWLFPSINGRKLTRARVWKLISEAAKLCGIDKNVHPHTLRHSFATHLLLNGADLRVIQELLGHSDLVTTQNYTHIDSREIKKCHQQFHPRQ